MRGRGARGRGVCCGMALPGRLRWRWNHALRSLPSSASLIFLAGSAAVSGLVGIVFFWLVISSFRRPEASAIGCQPDGEGSWSVGVYYGSSPLSLVPIESANKRNENSSAWPVANPVISCATATEAGYPSNFVADPFLFIQGNSLYLFFETKNSVKLRGEIGVARSVNQGASWEVLGIALQEDWHLSYPFVFTYNDKIYMMPEGSKRGDLRLYQAVNFPLQWEFVKVLVKKPLVDASLVKYRDYYWLFASDFSRFGTEKNAELEIRYSDSPLGPWKQHKRNPIYRSDKSLGARNGGRPFIHEGYLYRLGQDCGGTYGRSLRLYKVEKLSTDDYREVSVPLQIEKADKGRYAWNGIRHHHLDAQKLPSGGWIAVMDGDRVPSGDSTRRSLLGYSFIMAFFLVLMIIGCSLGAMNCSLPSSCISFSRSDWLCFWDRPQFNFKVRRTFANVNRYSSPIRWTLSPRTCLGKLLLLILGITGIILLCAAEHFLFGGDGTEQGYLFKGQYSQFTMVTMTYEARIWNLNLYIKHYSRCPSVREIVVVWNKGKPPNPKEFDSPIPVRIRVEEHNSLNNRFKVDPLIKTKAVLELDDDIMMTCNDIEKGFRVWREHPERIVGFYPRLLDGNPLKYRDERYARKKIGYNVILTGAAFMDSEVAFKRYWSEEASQGRALVDELFNCEDVLMNFLFANSSSERTVEYVHPAWAIDTSKLSTSAISRNTQAHYDTRSNCLSKFSAIYGPLPPKWKFGSREDRWDA